MASRNDLARCPFTDDYNDAERKHKTAAVTVPVNCTVGLSQVEWN
jgi:hypothetical protein